MNELPQVTFKKNLILTTEQLAEFYGTSVNTIQNNFNRNQEKFIENKHYYLLKGNQLKDFKNQVTNNDLVAPRSSHLYLWTKRGASRHSKMLGTDRAWDMYDQLEESYFNPMQPRLPQTPNEKIQLLLENAGDSNKKLHKIENRVTDLEDNQALNPGEYNYLSRKVNSAVAEYISIHHLQLNKQQRSKLFRDINRGVNEVTSVKTRSQLRKKDFDVADEFISNWSPSTATLIVIKQLGGEAEGQLEFNY